MNENLAGHLILGAMILCHQYSLSYLQNFVSQFNTIKPKNNWHNEHHVHIIYTSRVLMYLCYSLSIVVKKSDHQTNNLQIVFFSENLGRKKHTKQ